MRQLDASVNSAGSLPARFLIFLINIYRYALSPLLGQSCRFYPSCSHYGQEAIREHGARSGSMMTIKRILRCHPWHDGGFDPVPTKLDNQVSKTQL